MLEAVLFDFDGTLVDYIDSDIKSLERLHAHTGSSVSFDAFLETSVNEIMKFHDLVDNGEIDPLLMHDFRLKNTLAKYEMPWNSDYIDVYKKELIRTCTPFDGVENLLSEIGQKVKTGLITNAYDSEEQRTRIRGAGLEDYFDFIAVAGEVGMYKPDPSLFLHSLRCMNVAPGNALYIGDSITYDIDGAKAAGMKTILFSNSSTVNSEHADYVISGVEALHDLLKQLTAGRRSVP